MSKKEVDIEELIARANNVAKVRETSSRVAVGAIMGMDYALAAQAVEMCARSHGAWQHLVSIIIELAPEETFRVTHGQAPKIENERDATILQFGKKDEDEDTI